MRISENFEIEESSVKAGYNAVVGYAWWVEYKRDGLNELLQHVGIKGVALPFLGAVENHNTPRAADRAGGEKYSKYAFLLNCLLPRAIPFIHSGFELGETTPVNTGLDFSSSDLKRLNGKPLPLFDLAGFDWNRDTSVLPFTKRALEIYREYSEVLRNPARESFVLLKSNHPDVFAFIRKNNTESLLYLLNRDWENVHDCQISLHRYLGEDQKEIRNLLSGFYGDTKYSVKDRVFHCCLGAGEMLLLTW
ncbi:hypothetical protein HYY75_01900 [bacterium]|nr:hypothetical protein [bacterium]